MKIRKVVCINTNELTKEPLYLTYGKVYETVPGTATIFDFLPIDDFNYWIINDRGCKEYYSKDKFLTLEEWRKRKLNELGI